MRCKVCICIVVFAHFISLYIISYCMNVLCILLYCNYIWYCVCILLGQNITVAGNRCLLPQLQNPNSSSSSSSSSSSGCHNFSWKYKINNLYNEWFIYIWYVCTISRVIPCFNEIIRPWNCRLENKEKRHKNLTIEDDDDGDDDDDITITITGIVISWWYHHYQVQDQDQISCYYLFLLVWQLF